MWVLVGYIHKHSRDEKACADSEVRCLYAETGIKWASGTATLVLWSMNNVGCVGEHLKHLQIP